MKLFSKKTKTNPNSTVSLNAMLNTNKPNKKKRVKKIFFLSFLAIFIIFLGFAAFIVGKGSQIFDNGGGISSLFQTANGSALKAGDDGRINILAMGLGGASHPGGMLTDSMMVISYNPSDKSIAMLSIPRDLYVKIADHKVSTKINEAYSIGESEKKGTGAALAKKTVSELLDIPIHYYITLDFKGFEKIVDTLGGVDVVVDKTLYDPEYPDDKMVGYSPFSLKAGKQHLDGKTALKFARSRESTSDFDRAARQQKVIVALKDKAMSLGFLANPKKILDMTSVLSDNLRTDFTPAEMKEFISLIKDVSSDKIINKVLDNSTTGPLVSDSTSGTFYLKPKDGTYTQIRQIAQEIFSNPNNTDTKATLSILNATSTSGLAGKLANDFTARGYSVVNIEQSKTLIEHTIINDYNNGKNKTTLQFLKKGLGEVTVVAKESSSNTSGAQLEVVIGSDYKGFVNSNTN